MLQKSEEKIIQKDLDLKTVRDSVSLSQSTLKTLEAEKRDLFALNVKKQDEVTQLLEQLETSQAQVNSLRQELSMASHELTDVQSSDAKLRSEMAMAEQQLSQIKRNNTWLNEELQRNSKEFNDYRREKVVEGFL